VRTLIGTTLVLALTACGGARSTPGVNIVSSPVTVNTAGGPDTNVPTTLTVQPNGRATLAVETSPPQVQTITLQSSLVLKLYSDLAAAMPLSSLPNTTSTAGFFISVDGQTSPNIVADSGIAGTLISDVGNIERQFSAHSR